MTSPITYAATTSNTTILPAGTTPADNANPSIPQQIGEFAILKKLGEGAYGQVFLACQTSLDRQVALKITRGEETGRNEGQLLAGLEHDHIVKVFSEFSDLSTGTHGLCLQYVPGTDLGVVIQHIHAQGRVPDYGKAILAVLDAHRHGETSFDPAALRDRDALSGETFAQAVCRLVRNGGGSRVCAQQGHPPLRYQAREHPADALRTTHAGRLQRRIPTRPRHRALMGLAERWPIPLPNIRCAPWCSRWGVDERCDVYSLGVVLHELGTGERPEPCDPFIEKVRTGTAKKPDALDRLPSRTGYGDPSLPQPQSRTAIPDRRRTRHGSHGSMAPPGSPAASAPGRIGNWVNAHPVVALALAACLPHLAASVVNIGYNSVEIRLTPAQQQTFAVLVMSYNLLAYPVLLGIVGLYLWRLQRQLAGLTWASWSQLDEMPNGVQRWGGRTLVLGAVGWFPGGLLFPLVIRSCCWPHHLANLHSLCNFVHAGRPDWSGVLLPGYRICRVSHPATATV